MDQRHGIDDLKTYIDGLMLDIQNRKQKVKKSEGELTDVARQIKSFGHQLKEETKAVRSAEAELEGVKRRYESTQAVSQAELSLHRQLEEEKFRTEKALENEKKEEEDLYEYLNQSQENLVAKMKEKQKSLQKAIMERQQATAPGVGDFLNISAASSCQPQVGDDSDDPQLKIVEAEEELAQQELERKLGFPEEEEVSKQMKE